MSYFPHFHLFPDEGLKVVPLVVLTSFTHLQPQGPTLGSAVLSGMEWKRGGGWMGEMEKPGGAALLSVCPALGRLKEVRGLPTPGTIWLLLDIVTLSGCICH